MSTGNLAPERLEYAVTRCKANMLQLQRRMEREKRWDRRKRQEGSVRAYAAILAILEGARDERLSRVH